MKNILKPSAFQLIFTILILSLSLQGCKTADEFFGIAVLNTNTIADFGTPTLAKSINDQTVEFADIPSSKKKGNEAQEFVNYKILYMDKSIKDIKDLSASGDDRKDIKAKSIALYEFVIPIYKNEYMAYAKLCDNKGSQAQKEQMIQAIEQQYNAEFERKYGAVLESGKKFAADNDLNVNWD